jgi:hypothetical protein
MVTSGHNLGIWTSSYGNRELKKLIHSSVKLHRKRSCLLEDRTDQKIDKHTTILSFNRRNFLLSENYGHKK